ncbi:hypothetical protein F5146DRAFT_994601 [Armillaria mellea]|nr:hypothetical protein F5146DRAFT_994601 [Armillaria mellea]
MASGHPYVLQSFLGSKLSSGLSKLAPDVQDKLIKDMLLWWNGLQDKSWQSDAPGQLSVPDYTCDMQNIHKKGNWGIFQIMFLIRWWGILVKDNNQKKSKAIFFLPFGKTLTLLPLSERPASPKLLSRPLFNNSATTIKLNPRMLKQAWTVLAEGMSANFIMYKHYIVCFVQIGPVIDCGNKIRPKNKPVLIGEQCVIKTSITEDLTYGLSNVTSQLLSLVTYSPLTWVPSWQVPR